MWSCTASTRTVLTDAFTACQVALGVSILYPCFALLQVCDAPEVHSNGFHFVFDLGALGNLGFVVPSWAAPLGGWVPASSSQHAGFIRRVYKALL